MEASGLGARVENDDDRTASRLTQTGAERSKSAEQSPLVGGVRVEDSSVRSFPS